MKCVGFVWKPGNGIGGVSRVISRHRPSQPFHLFFMNILSAIPTHTERVVFYTHQLQAIQLMRIVCAYPTAETPPHSGLLGNLPLTRKTRTALKRKFITEMQIFQHMDLYAPNIQSLLQPSIRVFEPDYIILAKIGPKLHLD